jgi:hypothetical protein
MQVIARQQNKLAGPDHEPISVLTRDSDTKIAFDNIVIDNQVGRSPKRGRTMLGCEARCYTPGREELGV